MKSLTAAQVAEKVANKDELFILDVRNSSEYKDWKIEGENIESINVPYFDLIDGVDSILDKIPEDKDVLVVCAKEGSSKMVAEMLEEAGRNNISYLEGGMKAWSAHLRKVKVYQDENLKVYQFIRMGKGCLSYMIVSGKEAMIIDPARNVDEYLKAAEEDGVTITNIGDSHLHADHISGGKQLAEKTGAKYYLMKSEGAKFDHEPFEENDVVKFENVTLEVLAVKTPGHTPGSVSFLVNDKLLFSGDTIFVGGLGRPDLGGKVREWAKDLYDTIYNKISEIADDVIVLPAHYADYDDEANEDKYIGATLGDIRKRNEMMNDHDEAEFVEKVAASASTETPPNFEDIIAINRGEKEATEDEQLELEIGPNRCAAHHTA
ncbi:MAG: MBL fold metallo-hydrolase [Bacillaceae bacterium]|nr:MBL fold metallo-hydrolase [Bacillaceae bacterium]